MDPGNHLCSAKDVILSETGKALLVAVTFFKSEPLLTRKPSHVIFAFFPFSYLPPGSEKVAIHHIFSHVFEQSTTFCLGESRDLTTSSLTSAAVADFVNTLALNIRKVTKIRCERGSWLRAVLNLEVSLLRSREEGKALS